VNSHVVATLAWARDHGKGNCKGASQREARELSQREARELSQKEARELRQEEARELSQEEARESHHILPGVQESARECEGHSLKVTVTDRHIDRRSELIYKIWEYAL
jgi:hypothetical protein